MPAEAADFRTQPQLALRLLGELVTCDKGYGRSEDFLDGVARTTGRRCRWTLGSGWNGR